MEEVANCLCKAIYGCKADDSRSYGRLWEGLCMLEMLHPARQIIIPTPHHHVLRALGVEAQWCGVDGLFIMEPRYVHFEGRVDFLARDETPKAFVA